MSVLATSILIASVLIIMMISTCTVAFVHGWQDGPDNCDSTRHQWIPRAFYGLGWRLRRVRLDVARRELEQARQVRVPRLNRVLDLSVRVRLAHPEWDDKSVADEVRHLIKDHQ